MSSDYGSNSSHLAVTNVMDGLKKLYKENLRPLEEHYLFGEFQSSYLEDSDFDAKPFVLILGQYSTGKSSFIKYLLGREYPGCRIGPEPTTDHFVAVEYGTGDRCTPGNALATQSDKPFRSLQQFGNAFLNKFESSQCSAEILKTCTLIDTPGVLSGEKQRIGRTYDYPKVIEWFAERSDLILLIFDAHKLDISDELRSVFVSLRGNDDKVRVLLNKADMVSDQELMRVYGALMWALGKCVATPEVLRVYTSSFWEKPYKEGTNESLFTAEKADLMADLGDLPKNATIRKINELIKRARAAKIHALIISQLKSQMPAVFFKQSKQAQLVQKMDEQFWAVQHQYNLPTGDFPDLQTFKDKYRTYDFSLFNKLDTAMLQRVDDMLEHDLPALMQNFPLTIDITPFRPPDASSTQKDAWDWEISREQVQKYIEHFKTLTPKDGIADRNKAEELLKQSGLSFKTLSTIWDLADIDQDGGLDFDEFCVAMYLASQSCQELPLPATLPPSLVPPSKRASLLESPVMVTIDKPVWMDSVV